MEMEYNCNCFLFVPEISTKNIYKFGFSSVVVSTATVVTSLAAAESWDVDVIWTTSRKYVINKPSS